MGDAPRAHDAPDARTLHHLDTVLRGPLVLWEGTIADEAGLWRLVAAYDVVVTYHEVRAHLIVAGPARARAARRLQQLVVELALPDAWIAVDPSPPVLVAMRLRAAVRSSGAVPDVPPTLLAEHLLERIGRAPATRSPSPGHDRARVA